MAQQQQGVPFVRFTGTEGRVVLVKVEKVDALEEFDNGCWLHLSSHKSIKVKGTAKEVYIKLGITFR